MYAITRYSEALIAQFFAATSLQLGPQLSDFMSSWTPMSATASADLVDFVPRWLKAIPAALSGRPGEALHQVTLFQISRAIDRLAPLEVEHDTQDSGSDDMGLWVRDVAFTALAVGFSGKEWGWCSDPRMRNAYWDYEWALSHFILSPAPLVTAPTGYKARNILVQIFEDWMGDLDNDAEATEKLSALAKSVFAYPIEREWSNRDKACQAIVLLRATVSNEVPTLFWMFSHIFSQPALLARLREEARRFVFPRCTKESASSGDDSDLPNLAGMSWNSIREGCPLLIACLLETQRLATVGMVVRHVLQDTILTDEDGQDYLLKKNDIAALPLALIHTDVTRWGADSQEFVPERFLHQEYPKDAFFPFGAGRDRCPGRVLSSNMLVWMMLLFILGIDVQTADGEPYEMPEKGSMPLGILLWRIPRQIKQKIRITKTPEWESVKQRLFPAA
ncbi:cytochrome P450 [Microdochium bolleyi]|uniref:Cytochrome P450 n=1 Tax=Microdochium bolleyi TaxID=196109 RepID=A0A136ISH1_9PEZI|nr:cytochrome P450 [Microdochium bolleyi]